MKISISKQKLMKILFSNLGILDKKNSSPILNYCYFEVSSEGKIKTKATDLEISLLSVFECEEVEEPGAVLFNCKDFFEITKNLPEEKVIKISVNDIFVITIECGSSINFKLKGLKAEQYPTFPTYSNEYFSLPAKTLKTMIEKTIYAVSLEGSRLNLNGLYFEKREENGERFVRFVGTDGHRLALIDRVFEGWENISIDINTGVIIQRKGLVELMKILDDNTEQISMAFSQNQIVFKFDRFQMFVRLVDGGFPDYNVVIPKNNSKIININRKFLFDALTRISILTQNSINKIKVVQFKLSNNQLTVFSSHPEKGEAKETICIKYTAEDFLAGFNANYCMDVLKTSENENVWLKLADGMTAAIFYDDAVERCIHVLMPMRI